MPDINWAVVENGLDFMESAVQHLAEANDRDLRYAALHLNSAIETAAGPPWQQDQGHDLSGQHPGRLVDRIANLTTGRKFSTTTPCSSSMDTAE